MADKCSTGIGHDGSGSGGLLRGGLAFPLDLEVVLLVGGVAGLELGDGPLHQQHGRGDVHLLRQDEEAVGNSARRGVVVLANLRDEYALVGSVAAWAEAYL